MKRPTILALLALLVVASVSVAWRVASQRKQQRDWPVEMNRRCQSLALVVIKFREIHGRYPELLPELVHRGILSDAELQALSFQPSPWAERMPWSYFPETPEQILLASPEAVFPWPGHSGHHCVGFDNGLVHGLTSQKWDPVRCRLAKESPPSR